MIKEKVSRKQLIFIEAAKLFQAKGYAATSMRDLAAKVGLKPSSFYSHIKSKEEILERICSNAADRFLQGLEEVLVSKQTAHESWLQIIDLHIGIAFEDPSSITVFNDEWRHLSGEAASSFRNKRKNYQQGVIQIIKKAMEDQSLRKADPTLVFNTMIGATRWLHFIKEPNASSAKKIKDQVHDLLGNGMNN